jgi:D-alanyl-D-alanine carboxypeptidase (penicillin-binding protein 5/6)
VPKSRPTRWGLVALGGAVLLTSSFAYLRLRGPQSSPVAEAAGLSRTLFARDLTHPPWYGLKVVRTDLAFHTRSTPAFTEPDVPAAAGILVDMDTGEILWQRNAHEKLPMASTIKVLTALVALENFNTDQLITVTHDALFQAGDESKMFLKAGQTLSMRELLTGMLTASANDAADVVAIDTVGMERFVGAMNAQAQALGLHDTHVTTPVGLSDRNQHSSVYDLAVISTVDENAYPLFDDIVRAPYAFLPATATHPAFYMNNINLLLSMYPAAVGIKTGYTGDAGACEIGMAVRGTHRLLSVVLNGRLVYTETRRLLDWGFVQEGLSSQVPTPKPLPTPHA